jgi:transmembrane sensor
MRKEYISQLLAKIETGTASEAERQLILDYYDLIGSVQNDDLILSADEKAALKGMIKYSIDQQISVIEEEELKKNRPSIRKKPWMLAAAALIFLVLCTWLATTLMKGQTEMSAEGTPTIAETAHRLLVLPDGTRVIMDPGTKLEYSADFNTAATRKIKLEGLAYFDVAHDARKPFIVQSGELQTIVLGTAFRIRAWPSEKEVEITVTRGLVKVTEGINLLETIEPDKQLRFNRKTKTAQLLPVDISPLLKWCEEDLVFENLTIADVMKLLEERFKIRIVITDERIKQLRFTASFQKDEKIRSILDRITEFNGITYKIDTVKHFIGIHPAAETKR